MGGRFGGLTAKGQGGGKRGTAAGETGLLSGVGHVLEREPEAVADCAGEGGGVAEGLAVQPGACGSVDVCCGWHGLVFLWWRLVS